MIRGQNATKSGPGFSCALVILKFRPLLYDRFRDAGSEEEVGRLISIIILYFYFFQIERRIFPRRN